MTPKLSGTKLCPKCPPHVGPLPVIHFGADPEQEDGLSVVCRNCESGEEERLRAKKLERVGERSRPVRKKWQSWGGGGVDSLGSWIEE